MSYEVYKTLHFFGLIVAVLAVGGIFIQAKLQPANAIAYKRPMMIAHGIGVIIMLIAGFGLLARLNLMHPMPAWVWPKLLIWFYLGVAPTLVMRVPKIRDLVIWATPFILVTAAAFAVFKPS